MPLEKAQPLGPGQPLEPSRDNPIAKNVLPQQPAEHVNKNEVYIKVVTGTFGHKDSQPSGPNVQGHNPNTPTIIGASLTPKAAQSLLTDGKLIEIHNPRTSRTIVAPVIDTGLGGNSTNGIELTFNAGLRLGGSMLLKDDKTAGTSNLTEVLYRPLSKEEQAKFTNLNDGKQDQGHSIGSPLRDISKFIDLVNGSNNTRDESLDKLAKGVSPNHGEALESSPTPGDSQASGAAGAETTTMHTTTPITPSPVDTTAAPKGVFCVPEIGSMLWVFFRNGDPMFPVYFAASYGQAEWQQAYSAASPPMYYPGADPKKFSKQDCTMVMPNKGGGLHFTEMVHEDDHNKSNRGVKLYGYSGGHIEFNEQHNVYYSPRDDYQQADGNKFDICMSNRELYTKGDFNLFTAGNQFIKIGNISKSAHQAMDNINQAVNDINSKMMGQKNTTNPITPKAPQGGAQTVTYESKTTITTSRVVNSKMG